MLGIGQHNAGGNKTTTQISQDSFSNNGLKPSLWGVKTKQKANVPPCVMETARALVCRQWHLESIFPYFLALLPCILFSSQEDLSIMVARWLAAKSRLTLCWHSHPYSSSSYRLRGTFHCTKVGPVPIPPWSCKHPCPKPHGLKAMKGWVPTVAQGAGPGEEGRTAKAVSPLLCAMVSIKSHSSSSTTPPFLLYPAHNY